MALRLKKLVLIHTAVFAAVTVYALLPFKCPVKYFFGFDCPTCGMTRAILSLLRGDFKAYAELNPAALPFLLLLLFAFHRSLLPLSRRAGNIIVASGAVCVLFVYIFRLILV